MYKYNAASLVTMLRERIGLEREAVLMLSELDDSSLRRIESEKQHPKPETLESLMLSIALPLEGFVYSLLDDQPMGVYLLCDRLTQVLDIGDTVAAEELIKQLEVLPGFDAGIQLQFMLSKKARLWELQGKPANHILPLIEEGMDKTFKDFDENCITNKVFVLEEPELLHTKARVYAKAGKINASIRILENMVASLKKLPRADREKERQFAPVILSLSKCLLQTGDHERVLEMCDLGAEYSATRKLGQLNPEFEECKASALHGLNRINECRISLQHSYFGYMLLGDCKKANEMLSQARECFGIHFNLYGVDKLDFSHHNKVPYNRGEPVECNSLGSLISALRKRAGLSLWQLSLGICSKPTLLRIEKGETTGNYFTLEAIMQRLGRDISLYNNFFLSREDFITMQIRDRINVLLGERRYANASMLLSEFDKMKCTCKSNVLQQFSIMTKAILNAKECSRLNPEFPLMLLTAIKKTCQQFNENDIEKYCFSYNEIAIINLYASYFGDTGNYTKAAEIYQRLLRNINGKYVDEVERARVYSTLLFNLSSCLGRLEQFNEALSLITRGENFERGRGRIIDLPGFMFNKGYGLCMMNREAESKPYFALAYYGASMFSQYGQAIDLPFINETASKYLGINFC